MSPYKVVFAPTAVKQLEKLSRDIQQRVLLAITKLATDQHLGKQLKGELKKYRSYRVGDYRVIYFIRHSRVQIEIIRVAHRREVYRT